MFSTSYDSYFFVSQCSWCLLRCVCQKRKHHVAHDSGELEWLDLQRKVCKSHRSCFCASLILIFLGRSLSCKLKVGLLSVWLPVMDVLWLNSVRYGLSCYWSLIGSRILAFKWHINRCYWMALKGYNALWDGIFQAISGHVLKTVWDRAKVTIHH